MILMIFFYDDIRQPETKNDFWFPAVLAFFLVKIRCFLDFARFTNLAISLKTVIASTYDCFKVKLAVRAYLFAHTGPISLAFQMRKIDFEKFVYMHVYMLFINPFLYNLKLIFFFRFFIYLAFFMLNKIHAFRRICFL